MQLSKYFSLSEMIKSDTAERLKIDNTPYPRHIKSLRSLCTNVLDPIREAVGKPVYVTSGYRCRPLNKAVNGSTRSQHIRGEAADIYVKGMTPKQLFDFILSLDLEFDQIIDEFGEWVHITYTTKRTNRRQALEARREKGRVVFTEFFVNKNL
jgi:zinc D-Ala-D-Ala carboxypeptidase